MKRKWDQKYLQRRPEKLGLVGGACKAAERSEDAVNPLQYYKELNEPRSLVH